MAEYWLLKQLAERTPLEGEQGLRSSDFGLRWPCTARLTVLGGMHRAREEVTQPILSFRLILNDIATQYVKITRSFSLQIIRFFSRFRFSSCCAMCSHFYSSSFIHDLLGLYCPICWKLYPCFVVIPWSVH